MKVSQRKRNSLAIPIMILALAMGAALLMAQSADALPLEGIVRTVTGEPLAGIPVRASMTGRNLAFVVYSNREGRYKYQDLSAGTYTVDLWVAGFEPAKKEGVTVTKTAARLDFTLKSVAPGLLDLTTAEVLLSLPGSEETRQHLAECSNCHSLQFALQHKMDRAQWLKTIEKMRGLTYEGTMDRPERVRERLRRTEKINPELAELLTSITGPDAMPLTPKLLPRPSDEASTQITITEYQISRGAIRATLRGDPRAAWTHDVLPDRQTGFVWYADHIANILGRLDPKTGEIQEFTYPKAKPDRRGGGGHPAIDKDGNIWVGSGAQESIVKLDPTTGQFQLYTMRENEGNPALVRVDSAGNVWTASPGTSSIHKLEVKTGKFSDYSIPPPTDIYGGSIGLDSKDIVYFCGLNSGNIGRLDPKAGKFTIWPTPTPHSGPRRLAIDDRDRFWFAEFFAGKIGMFDPKTETIHEWAIPGNRYAAPYVVAVDNKNQAVWANDFNNNRIFRFDIKTEKFTEFLLPEPDVEIRHISVDDSTIPPTVWIPDYSPPGKILKVQAW